MTDSQLLEGLKNNSEKAFAFFYKQMVSEVKSYIRRNSGDEDDAKDIFQDAVMALLRNIKEGKYDNRNLKGYFMTIVRYKWLDRIDGRKPIAKMSVLPEFPDEDHDFEISNAPRLGDYFHKVLRQLGDPCRSLIMGTIVFKKTMEEMALRLNYSSAHSARQQKLQCLKKLRLLVNPAVIAGLS